MALATREAHTVRINEVDLNQQMTISALLQLMQEVAWNNAEELDASVYELQKHGITWVMTRLKLEIFAYPQHRQQIEVETWPAGSQRSFVYRDYRVYDLDGNLLAQATSTWLVFDIESRRMTKIADFLIEKVIAPAGCSPLERATGRLTLPEKDQGGALIPVRWHDLDPNGHVNNSLYLQWVLESLPDILAQQKQIKEIDLMIRAECGLGDTIHSIAEIESSYVSIHGLWRKQDEKLLAQARVIWTSPF